MNMFDGLEEHSFRTILADPPWNFRVRSEAGTGRSASNHYSTMTLQDIKRMPVGDFAELDSWLFLWATTAMLPEALDVMRAWRFTYCGSAFCWVKQNKSGNGFFTGMGYTTRKNVEICLLGRRGSPVRRSMGIRELIVSPRREHSRKPDETRERIEKFCWGPRLDLFSRESRPGWVCRGHEAGKFDPENNPKINADNC